MRAFRTPLFEQRVGPMPYSVLQSLFERFYPPGLQWDWSGTGDDFVRGIPEDAVARYL